MSYFKKILNIFFPLKCIVCDTYETETYVCSSCWSKINFITKPYCKICSFPFLYEEDDDAICGSCVAKHPSFKKLTYLMKYDQHSKKIIHRFKYQDKLEILNYLTNLMCTSLKDTKDKIDFVAPVPMHKLKIINRGYNQSALLASKLAKKLNKEYLPDLLIKLKNSKPQMGLSKKEREKNVKNTIRINNKLICKIHNKNILLVDDVITTGSTIKECCKILQQNSCNEIYISALARRL